MSYTDPGTGTSPRVRKPRTGGIAGALGKPRHPATAAHPPRRPANHAIDPFAPITEQQIAQRANQYGPVRTDKQMGQQAGREARSQIAPLLAGIESDIGRRETAAQGNLLGATKNYANIAAQYAPTVGAAYGQAEGSQANVDAALAQSLSGQGQQLGQELGAKLAAAGLSSPAPANAVATGTGAGNAAVASGSAELSRLLAGGAAEQAYGAKLPGIAANTGLQRAGELAGAYQAEHAQRSGEVTSQLPSLIQNLLGQLRSTNEAHRADRATAVSRERDRATNAAVFRKEYGLKEYGAQTDRQRARAAAQHSRASDATRNKALNVSAAALGVRASHDAATEQNANRRADISASHNAATERNAAKNARTTAARLKQQGRQVDPEASRNRGIEIGKDGRPILKYKVKDGHRVKGSGRTIPYKPKPTSSKSSAGPPPGSPKAK